MDPVNTPRYWLTATVILIVLEILPPAKHFFLLCFALGALFGAIAAAYTHQAWIPWAVFVVVSAGLLPLLVPLAKFLFRKPSQG
jgi:membrane protein implicated in regulation of membrane protease activity